MTGDDRAERAFADAFARHADRDFEPLDPDAVLRPAPTPLDDRVLADRPAPRAVGRRWLPLAAAAALLVTAGSVALTTQFRPPVTAVAPASGPQAQEGVAGAPVADRAGGGAALPDPGAGWRYESFLDVVVPVPMGWGYDLAPGSDWCADTGHRAAPAAPFVDLNPRTRAVRAIACPTDVPPADRRQAHLTHRLAVAGDAPTTDADDRWLTRTAVVGSAYLTVVVPAGSDALAARILDGARVVDADHHGCGVAAPGSRPTGAAAGLPDAAEALVLCQYAAVDRPGPHLVASAALGRGDATRVLDAVRARPVVDPADAVEPDCAAAPTASSDLLVLRFGSGAQAREVHLAYNGCRPFVLDDGVVTRSPDAATAGVLLARRPLAVWSSWGRQGTAVLPPR